jgi:hypothetical protein
MRASFLVEGTQLRVQPEGFLSSAFSLSGFDSGPEISPPRRVFLSFQGLKASVAILNGWGVNCVEEDVRNPSAIVFR